VNALKGQKLKAQGNALGMVEPQQTPCRGKSQFVSLRTEQLLQFESKKTKQRCSVAVLQFESKFLLEFRK